jgi:hypothetical protein
VIATAFAATACAATTPPPLEPSAATGTSASSMLVLAPAPPRSPAETILAIAHEIDALKPACPHLADFDLQKHVHGAEIDYAYHTHRADASQRGGWTKGVPNPDADGVWIYIDIHDPASQAQIHTQPAVPMLRVGNDLLMMLILEGERVPPCAGRIWAILSRYGKGPPGM